MSDSTEIHNLLSDEQMESSLMEYTSSNLENLTDIQNGNYSASTFTFDFLPLISKWTVLSDMVLSIPLTITSSGTAYSAATLVSFKQSILNFITSVQISTSSGSTIVSDYNVSLINNLRPLLEKDRTWYDTVGKELQFVKDETALPTATLGGAVSLNDAHSTTGTQNIGFIERIGLLKQNASGTTSWTTTLNIPLKYLHDFFQQCDYPMINQRWVLTFGFAGSSSALAPMIVDNSTTTVVSPPTLSITTGQQTRLYYKSVSFSPALNQQLVARLNSGYERKIFYRVSDLYFSGSGLSSTNSIQQLVTPSSVRPLRVWMLGYLPTSLSTSGSTTVSGTAVPAVQFTNCQVFINNTPYYMNPLNQPQELWEVIKEQFPHHGSTTAGGGILSYSDFLNNYRIHLFDVSRLKDRVKNPNEAVSIQVNATPNAYTVSNIATYDLYFVVERLAAVTMKFSSAETKIISGL